jgi:hypothetical protein
LQAGHAGEGRSLGRHLLVNEAVDFVFHFLLFFFLAVTASAATIPGSFRLGGCFADVPFVIVDLRVAGSGTRPEGRAAVV